MTETVMLPRQSRSVNLRAESFDADANTVEVVFTTGAAVMRSSWFDGDYVETLDVTSKAVRLGRLNAGAPFLDTHASYDLGDVIGAVVPGSARIENGLGLATIKLSGAAADADTIGKIRDGVIRNVSVGYLVHQALRTEASDAAPASVRVTDWEPIEISAVPIPADPGSQIRAAGVDERHPCLVMRAAQPSALQTVASAAQPHAAIIAALAEARAAETARVQGIRSIARKLALPEAMVEAAVEAGTDLAEFRALAIEAIATRTAGTLADDTINPASPAASAASPGAAAMSDRATDTHTPADPNADAGRAATPAPSLSTAAGADAIAAARAAETARVQGILATVRKLGLPEEVADRAIAETVALDAFRVLAIDAAAGRQAPASFNVLPSEGQANADAHRVYAQPAEKLPKGTDASRAMLALAATRGSKSEAAAFVDKHYGRSGQALARALTTSIGTAGGFLVPDVMSTEIIELLRPESTVMALGPNIIPMPNGNFSMSRVTGGALASYVGETTVIPSSQETFGKMQLSAKKLAALVPLSNDMIRFPSIQVDGVVRADMVAAIAQRADLAFLRGGGTQYSPRGFLSLAADPVLGGQNVVVATPTPTLTSVTTDLGNTELCLANANVKMRKPGWIFSQRTRNFLYNLRDGLGNQVFKSEMDKGMLRGKPFAATTQIPNNLAAVDGGANATTDGSEVYLADFAEVYVGEAYGLEIAVFDGGTYQDSNGVMVSGISTDETVMRAIVQHDINMRQQAAVAVLVKVRWY